MIRLHNFSWRAAAARHAALAAMLISVACLDGARAEEPAAKPAVEKPVPSREELEKQFAEKLGGATFIGHYTTGGEKPTLSEERYQIAKVSKVKDDLWLFQSRIHFGKYDLDLPLPLTVKWAGDTAVITVNDLTIPGLGTVGARVLIYRDQYAGTWTHGDHAGHLFGKIVKLKNSEEKQ